MDSPKLPLIVVPALLVLALALAMVILAWQVIAAVRGKGVAVRIENGSRAKPLWFGGQTMLRYHLLDPRLWFEIVRARDLPWNAEHKQRLMRILLGALIVVLLGIGGLSIYLWSGY